MIIFLSLLFVLTSGILGLVILREDENSIVVKSLSKVLSLPGIIIVLLMLQIFIYSVNLCDYIMDNK